MIHRMVSVWDAKAEAFGKPIFVQSHGAAVRSFADAVNSPEKEHDFAKYPQDFTLFAMGDFDDQTGKFTILRSPLELAKAISLVTAEVTTPAGRIAREATALAE